MLDKCQVDILVINIIHSKRTVIKVNESDKYIQHRNMLTHDDIQCWVSLSCRQYEDQLNLIISRL